MELLFTKNPIVSALSTKSIKNYTDQYFQDATQLNIATGFVSNESIVQLNRLIEYRSKTLKLSLFIGMNYLDGFTKLQYEAVKELGYKLSDSNLGHVFVSPKAMFHGKMYSFLKENECLGSFIGSSNLGSFIGTTQKYIESDMYFESESGLLINEQIINITNKLGTPIIEIEDIKEFKEPDNALLDGYEHVTKLTKADLNEITNKATDVNIKIELKTTLKSNLNTSFGAGKIKGKFSPRDYYEVEVIIGTKTPNIEKLPHKDSADSEDSKDSYAFNVVTTDGYMFECSRQGSGNKNFRSTHNLKILGRWIKGQMENAGALKIGELVTEDTISKFGKTNIVLTQTTIEKCWILSLE